MAKQGKVYPKDAYKKHRKSGRTGVEAVAGAVKTAKKYTYGKVKESVNAARARRTTATKKKAAAKYKGK